MQLIKILIFLLPSFLVSNVFANSVKKSTVLICYGKLKPETIKGYRFVILESKYYLPSDIRVIKANNDKVFAYISLGEVNANAPHYKELKEHTLGKNHIWDSYYLDLKSEKTKQTLIGIIDKTLAIGYDGLFLDNIDNFSTHGPQKDQKEELIKLLKTIKEKFPNKEFIQNAGIDIIGETSSFVSAVAIESVASNYTFKNKSYKLRNSNEYNAYMSRLKTVYETYKMPIILIEYADSINLCNKIEERIKPTKFDYFIGSIDLQKVPDFKK